MAQHEQLFALVAGIEFAFALSLSKGTCFQASRVRRVQSTP